MLENGWVSQAGKGGKGIGAPAQRSERWNHLPWPQGAGDRKHLEKAAKIKWSALGNSFGFAFWKVHSGKIEESGQ